MELFTAFPKTPCVTEMQLCDELFQVLKSMGLWLKSRPFLERNRLLTAHLSSCTRDFCLRNQAYHACFVLVLWVWKEGGWGCSVIWPHLNRMSRASEPAAPCALSLLRKEKCVRHVLWKAPLWVCSHTLITHTCSVVNYPNKLVYVACPVCPGADNAKYPREDFAEQIPRWMKMWFIQIGYSSKVCPVIAVTFCPEDKVFPYTTLDKLQHFTALDLVCFLWWEPSGWLVCVLWFLNSHGPRNKLEPRAHSLHHWLWFLWQPPHQWHVLGVLQGAPEPTEQWRSQPTQHHG